MISFESDAFRIGAILNVLVKGENRPIRVLSPAKSPEMDSLTFLNSVDFGLIDRLNHIKHLTCITTEKIAQSLECDAIVIHPNPRLAFALAVNGVVSALKDPWSETHPLANASVHPDATLEKSVRMGFGCVIGKGVKIGAGTVLGNNVVVGELVTIGRDCKIKSNTTIGESGFGFVADDAGVPVHFPHLASVDIGDNVEIGANCTVVRGALENTVVEDHVKTDDHVHIAHNCIVGRRANLAAGAILSGSVIVGEGAWIGPGASVAPQIRIGKGAYVTLGSVVARDVADGQKVTGNFAIDHKKFVSNYKNSIR